MVKRSYLFGVFAAVWFCGYAGSYSLGNKEEGVRNKEDTKREVLLSVARAEVGVREATGKNDGKRVESYLAYTGNKKGDAWCAAFVCWVLGQAAVENPRSAWSPDLFPEKRRVWRRDWKKQVYVPQAGDVFGIWFSDKGRIAHCGFVDNWQDSQVITVEGNTNDSGSRDGDGVYRKRRAASSIYAVADWVSRGEAVYDF